MQPHTGRLSHASAGVVPAVQRWSVDEIETTIGEPLIADPLLTAAQAAVLLGVTLVSWMRWWKQAAYGERPHDADAAIGSRTWNTSTRPPTIFRRPGLGTGLVAPS